MSKEKKWASIRSFWRMLMPEVEKTVIQQPTREAPPPRRKPFDWFGETPLPGNAWWHRLGTQAYLWGYGMGMFTKWAWRWFLRLLVVCLTPVGKAVDRLWKRTAVKQWRRVTWEWQQIRYGFVLAKERVVIAKERHVLLGLLQAILLPYMALRRHRRLVSGITQTLMVAGSVLLLTFVIRYWQNTTFALELVYGGEHIGYIEDESVFKDAVDMAESRVVKNAEGYVIERESYMTLRPVQQSAVLTKTELCDAILEMSGSDVTPMSGLYVDGVFEGALAERADMDRLLSEILSQYDTEANAATKTAEFKNKVEIVDGLYPIGSNEPYRALFKRMSEYLTVQIRCTEVYTETIPYEKVVVKDSTKPEGYAYTRTNGQEGVREITADVIYINGQELYREIVSETVIKEPVDQVTVIGSYLVNPDASAGEATGQFLWPLPSCRILNSPYGYRWGKLHAGIDISGNGVNGKPIIASDGGVVSQVNASGWGGGYGLYVIIDHGNGYTSVYCHCSAINVKVGQKVKQGQTIALVGNTGNSFGPHLHFELRLNGRSIDPEPYLK